MSKRRYVKYEQWKHNRTKESAAQFWGLFPFPSVALIPVRAGDGAANGESCTEILFQAPLPPDSLVLGLYRAPHPFCTVTASVGACVGARVCVCVCGPHVYYCY